MAEYRNDKDRADSIKAMISACGDASERLTDWETQFIESVSDQFDRRGTLSDKQVSALEGIYNKLT